MKKTAILLALVGFASFSAAQPAYLLRIKAKPGQAYKYKMDIDQGTTAKIGMNMTMKVTKVQKGETTINTTMGAFTMNGQPAPAQIADQMKKLLIVSVMDARGRTLRTETKGLQGFSGAANQGNTVPYPEKPVKVGGTWTGEAEMRGTKVKTSYKLVGVKAVAGRQAAVIHAVPSNMPGLKLSGPIVFSVELATGFPISMSMSGTATQGTATQKIKMTMLRV
jgi:hypothetical protein